MKALEKKARILAIECGHEQSAVKITVAALNRVWAGDRTPTLFRYFLVPKLLDFTDRSGVILHCSLLLNHTRSYDVEGHELRMLTSAQASPMVYETGGSAGAGGPLEYWERVQ